MKHCGIGRELVKLVMGLAVGVLLGVAWFAFSLSWSAVPVTEEFMVRFQGVQGKVRLYDDVRWRQVLQESDQPGTVTALYDPLTNTIQAWDAHWRETLAHEASHLFDARTRARGLDEQFPQCRADPVAYGFDGVFSADVFQRHPELLDYHCTKAEVLARYRAMVFRERCGDAGFGYFGLPRETYCAGVPDFRDLTLDSVLRAVPGG